MATLGVQEYALCCAYAVQSLRLLGTLTNFLAPPQPPPPPLHRSPAHHGHQKSVPQNIMHSQTNLVFLKV